MIGPREVDKDLVLYGAGRLGHLAMEIFDKLNIPYLLADKKLPCPVAQYREDFLVAVCIASEPYAPIAESLKAQGWKDTVPVWDILEFYADRTGIRNGWLTGELEAEDQENILSVIGRFEDQLSKNAYISQFAWRQGRIEHADFISVGRPPLPSTLADIRARQKVQTDFIWPRDSISIHAEGRELRTLEVNMELLRKFRPKIDVACYHSRDGLWKIQKTLMDNLPDYRWTFRLHAYQGQAAYLYGVPEEKV